MGFRKTSSSDKYKETSSSNLEHKKAQIEAKNPNHMNRGHESFVNTKSKKAFNKFNGRLGQELYMRGLNRKTVQRMLFIQEGIIGFEELPLRSKMTEVINQSAEELQDLFYDLGVDNELPKCWETFKSFVVEYCIEENINTIEKFKEENWSSYFKRLREWCFVHKISEEKMFKKLRSERLPNELKCLFYSLDMDSKKAYDRIVEYENFGYSKKNSFDRENLDEYCIRKSNFKENKNINCYICGEKGHISTHCKKKEIKNMKKEDTPIKCFKCNKIGHISRNCPDNKMINNSISKIKYNIDERTILLNGFKRKAIFDTGASESMLSSEILKELPKTILVPDKKDFVFFDGSKNTSLGIVELDIEYEREKIKEKFNVMETRGTNKVLICNNTVKKLLSKKKSMPIECCINTGNHYPISWNRPIKSNKDKQDFEKLILDLEKNGIIENSESVWLNPVVLTRKRNNELRFCVDFRKLNNIVELDEFSIPKIDEIIASLRDKKYFTTIDLKDGFFQVPIKESDKEKTAFHTGKRLMQFTKMPQGYKNSPAIFQRTMNLIFKNVLGLKCLVYIDDILIYGETLNEHDENLKEVLEIIEKYGLVENRIKRIERKERIQFLGYTIERNKIKPTDERAQGIIDYPEPKNKKCLQRFLGMINFDRIFIKNITEILKPLYKLLGNETRFEWKKEEKKSFELIKMKMKENLELIMPDFEKKFYLETDASDIGIGAALRQEGNPIAYASRSLNNAEKNYGITERETLAALWGMEKFQYYLSGRNFILLTDHKALEEIKNKKQFGSRRIQRWFERFEHFDFSVEYRKGTEIIVADALSRSPKNEFKDGEEWNTIVMKIKDKHIELNHRKDIKNELEKIGINLSREKIVEILSECEMCIRKDKKIGKSCKYVNVDEPGELMGIDILEINNKMRIVMAIDYFSRKIWAKVLTSKESFKILKFLKNLFSEFKFKRMITDNGKEFSNFSVRNWAKNNGIVFQNSIPYYHQSNGRIERANRTIRNAIRKTQGPVKMKIVKIIENYNKLYHRAIGMSPNEAMMIENHKSVREYTEKYKKEFKDKIKKEIDYDVGDKVLIRNEFRKNKMEDEFKEEGIINKKENNKVYEVINKKGKIFRRHSSQLKRLKKGEVGLSNNPINSVFIIDL